jgi:sugar phosphate isomerase/epimerase
MLEPSPVSRVGPPTQDFVDIGEGVVDWAAVFRAAQGDVKLYVIEQDPPVEPFSFARNSFEYVDCLVF